MDIPSLIFDAQTLFGQVDELDISDREPHLCVISHGGISPGYFSRLMQGIYQHSTNSRQFHKAIFKFHKKVVPGSL